MVIRKFFIVTLIFFSLAFIACDKNEKINISEDYFFLRLNERNSEIQQYSYQMDFNHLIEYNMSYTSNDGDIIKLSSNESIIQKLEVYIDRQNKNLFSNTTLYDFNEELNLDAHFIYLEMLIDDIIYEKEIYSNEYMIALGQMLDNPEIMEEYISSSWSKLNINQNKKKEIFLKYEILENYLNLIMSGSVEIKVENKYYVVNVFPDTLKLVELITEMTRPYTNFKELDVDKLLKKIEIQAKVNRETFDLVYVKIKSEMLFTKDLMGDNFFPSDSEKSIQVLEISFKNFNKHKELINPI